MEPHGVDAVHAWGSGDVMTDQYAVFFSLKATTLHIRKTGEPAALCGAGVGRPTQIALATAISHAIGCSACREQYQAENPA